MEIHGDTNAILAAVPELMSANAALRARLAEAEGELWAVDEVLARRDVLEPYHSRIEKILYTIGEAKKGDDAVARATRAEAELAEERAFHGECPGGCGYWKEAAKMREAERDEAEARIEALEWLLEVERFWYSHPGNGSCWWDSIERKHSTAEAKVIWKAALAECGEG